MSLVTRRPRPALLLPALTLTFRAAPGGPALTTVTARLAGCGTAGVTVGGQRQVDLGPYGGGRTLAARALKLAGLHRKLPW